MDPNSSLGRICLGDDMIVISSDKAEGSGDWNSLEYKTPLLAKEEEFDGEINLAFDENLISNEFARALLCKFIINPEEDDFIPGVILRRSFLRLSHGIVDFGNGVITIYPELDPFEDDSEKTGKSSNDWDQ
ncbi:hypothetical protein Tco_0539578 [Tanacetum coccineum]